MNHENARGKRLDRIEMVSQFLGAFIDRLCVGKSESAVPRVATLYVDMVAFISAETGGTDGAIRISRM